jgi:virginiamycin A acetyltransferase
MANPNLTFPRPSDATTVYLKNVIKRPQNVVGDFTIYNDPFCATEFETRNVLYQQTPYLGRLIIGKYCSIASGARFLFNSANHTLSSFSTYPFPLFGDEWESEVSPREAWDHKGDIVIGNDVWIGYEAVVLAGVRIGDGAIVGTRALVTKDVPPYSIVGGVPAKILRHRFDSETIAVLLKIRWWDWPHELVRRNLDAIRHMRLEELKTVIAP